jgi:hypothetical protein
MRDKTAGKPEMKRPLVRSGTCGDNVKTDINPSKPSGYYMYQLL